jgi:glycosyltransferase involved in cell wall biosynthesis
VRLAFIYNKGRLARLPLVESGESPTEFFYGAIELTQQGIDVDHFEVDLDEAGGWAVNALDSLMPRQLRPVKVDLRLVANVRRIAERSNEYDCMIATAGNVAFALAFWAALGVLRCPLIGIQCGVLEYRHSRTRRSITQNLLERMHTVLFGDAELGPFKRYFQLSDEKISVNQFGVDTNFWTPASGAGDYVLAVGNDGRRDYDTLLAAAPKIEQPIKLVTNRPLPSDLPRNVTVLKGSWHNPSVSDVQLRELYRKASCVVVPLLESLQPSGQSVALQAMSCGKPLILTKTRGLWSEQMMIEGKNVLFVKPGDPDDIAAKVRMLTEDRDMCGRLGEAGRAMACDEGNITRFAQRMGRVVRGMVEKRPQVAAGRA